MSASCATRGDSSRRTGGSTTRSSASWRRCSNHCARNVRDTLCTMGKSRLAAALLVASAGMAAAQPAPPSDKQKQQAGELVKKAIARSQAGDHETAIELYLQSYAM